MKHFCQGLAVSLLLSLMPINALQAAPIPFSPFVEPTISVKPQVPPYKIAPSLKNVSNTLTFDGETYVTFEGKAKELFVKNAFVVQPGNDNEFYPLYENNRYSYYPSFVTTDSMLHNYHLLFDHLLKKLEEQQLSGELKKLTSGMLAISLKQYATLKGTAWENAARRNVAYFSVASKLLDSSTPISSDVKSLVGSELKLITAHQGIALSPVLNLGSGEKENKEDYSQYIPRGHYDKKPILRNYFKAMLWYGRLTFKASDPDALRSAVLITLALDEPSTLSSWSKIYETTSFFVGQSDDLSYYQLKSLLQNVYSSQPTLPTLLKSNEQFAAFQDAVAKSDPPKINSVPIFNKGIQPDRESAIKGFRFMGQRYTLDADIFQRLVEREVSERYLPKGLDIPAAMGSTEALKILQDLGETKYKNYAENMAALQKFTAGLPTSTWTQNLYWGWLYTLLPLTTLKPEGYPSFMRNAAWARKEINTYLGSWTELKHDTVLYAKQVMAEMGGTEPTKKDDRGYVEPNPQLYGRLAALARMTRAGLKVRNLLSANNQDSLTRLETLATALKQISEKELANQSLSKADYELIRSYGGQLEHFWLEVNKEEMQGMTQEVYLDQNPAALVTDVATDPNGKVLQEGTGTISQIYVAVPIDGKLRIASGGVYSYYEFTQPSAQRLTDKAWRDRLRNDQAPPLPDWTSSFFAVPKP